MLQSRAITAFAQSLLFAKYRCNRRYHLYGLLRTYKGIQPHAQVRIRREPTADPH